MPTPKSAGYRFIFTQTRGMGSVHDFPEIQLAEIRLNDASGSSVLLPGTLATNSAGRTVYAQQDAAKAIDGHVETKWVDAKFRDNNHKSVLEITLPSAHAVSSYQLWTANDVVHRDPTSWFVQMRMANEEWLTIDRVDAADPPMARLAAYATITLQMPELDQLGWPGGETLPHPPDTPSPTPSVDPSPPTRQAPVSPVGATLQTHSMIGYPSPPTRQAPVSPVGTILQTHSMVNVPFALASILVLAFGLANVAHLWGSAVRHSMKLILGDTLYSRLTGCISTQSDVRFERVGRGVENDICNMPLEQSEGNSDDVAANSSEDESVIDDSQEGSDGELVDRSMMDGRIQKLADSPPCVGLTQSEPHGEATMEATIFEDATDHMSMREEPVSVGVVLQQQQPPWKASQYGTNEQCSSTPESVSHAV